MQKKLPKGLAFIVLAAALTTGQEKITSNQPEQSKTDFKQEQAMNPVVFMKTSLGTLKIELFQDKAPISVKNFLSYVDDKFYSNTVFHRVMKNFMIQGGGFVASTPIKQKKVKAPIVNESTNGLKNERGTIAMARTPDPNSATSQFFINVTDNGMLNRRENDAGYAVFGKVIEGMEVVHKIEKVQTGNRGMHQDVPVEPVIIQSMRVEI